MVAVTLFEPCGRSDIRDVHKMFNPDDPAHPDRQGGPQNRPEDRINPDLMPDRTRDKTLHMKHAPASTIASNHCRNQMPPSHRTTPSLVNFEELTRVFNTALVSTRAAESKSASSELLSLIESPAFKAILVAARQLAAEQGISEREATERVIQVFRKVDQIWCGYLYQEGVSSVLKN